MEDDRESASLLNWEMWRVNTSTCEFMQHTNVVYNKLVGNF